MNISVRVISANARAQIAALQAQVRALEGQISKANAVSAAPNGINGSRNRKSMMSWGNQIQWTGRQLQYNWTLPLLLAGGAATKFALDNEKAFTRVQKVYGDTDAAASYFRKNQDKIPDGMNATSAAAAAQKNELDSLGKAFEALSNRYGVAQKEVLETAGAWAAAGSSGEDLARSTELSLKAAILGDMDLAKATESLIAIQSQYSLSTKQLGLTLAELNAIENQTGISMQGLIDGFGRSAGVAREAGVDVRHLGAMLAALVPATGSAATAGNALKTIISRLMSPTGDAAKVMAEFGVNTADAAWQSSTAVERLTILAGHMGDSLKKSADGGYELSDSQKQVVASVLGSRYQMNRFLVLMREMGPEQTYYEKALAATADRQKVFATATKELNAVLDSSPQRLQIIWTTLQNGMADAVQPLIPYLLYLAQSVANAVRAFGELDPAVQKLFLIMGVGLAVLPLMIRYFGSLGTLVGALLLPFAKLRLAYIGWMTISEVVNGKLVTTRRNILGVIASFLAWPFAKIASGFGSLVSYIARIAMWLIRLPAMASGIGAAMTAAGSLIAAAWGAGASAMIAAWRGIWAALILIQTIGMKAVLGRWIWGLLAMPKALLAVRRGLTTAWAVIVGMMRTGSLAAAAAAAGPWLSIGAAIIGAIYLLRDQISQVWNNIVSYFSDSSNQMTQFVLSAWNALPQGISNALVAVARIVQQAALQIYEWFSYINPFAHHSPSLVENVTAGMKVIGDQFGGMRTVVGGHIKGAYADIKAFGNAVKKITGGAANFEQAQNRAKIKKFAPGALDEFDALSSRLKQLQGDLGGLEGRMNSQQVTVDRWTQKVEAANEALDEQQSKLDKLTAVQESWQSKLDGAQDRLSSFANAPISGMREMSDKIFENEIAQKRLRLEMMKMEDTVGTLDEVRSKIEAINAAQEMLRGEKASLRAAGAGSEILSQYDEQIAALEATKNQQNETAGAIQNMSDKLAELERQGSVLDLENSLKFDPLTHQIEAAANAMQELPFDEIMTGVRDAQQDIGRYGEKLDEATRAVERQQAVVDRMTAARDQYQARLDREQDALDDIKDRYDKIAEAISAVEQAMNDTISAADTMGRKSEEALSKAASAKKASSASSNEYTSPAVQNFRDAKGGNFANVGGAGIPLRDNWSDQSAGIDKFTQDIANQAGSAFGDLNPFAPLKKKWDDFVIWLKSSWSNFSAAAGDMFSNIFSGTGKVAGSGWFTDTIDKFKIAWAATSEWFKKNVIDPLVLVWRLFWPSIKEFLVNAWRGIKDMFAPIGRELGGLFKEVAKMGPAFKGLWNILKPILGVIGGAIAIIVKLVLNVLAKTIRPALALIGDVIGAIVRVIKGALQIVSGFFMLFAPGHFTEGLKKMAAGVGNIFGGLIDAIFSIIKNGAKIIFGAFLGIIDGIIDAAKWLWDVLVGHSIIPDLVNGIIFWFEKLVTIVKWLWNNVVTPIFNLFRKLFNGVIALVKLWWTGVTAAWNALKALGGWFWNNVLNPVWNFVSSLWKDYVAPALSLWWQGVKFAWRGLTTAGKWIWNNVLKPVWNWFRSVWSDRVGPELRDWWARIKGVWNNLKQAGRWIWDNALKPVWNWFKDLWTRIAFELRAWWARIKVAWNSLKAVGRWVWDNVLNPVFTRVKNLWTNVKTSLSGWWSGIVRVWNSLKSLGKWIGDNVMGPVKDKITGVWESIKNWLTNNKDMLTGPVKGIVNVVIDAVNAIIRGLNKVSSILPGDGFKIGTITRLEEGGNIPTRRVGSGFKTNGARAIVGEGKANHPEFVIPTDPTHRRRATKLLLMAANQLGVIPGGDMGDVRKMSKDNTAFFNGVPAYGLGGWLGDRIGDVKSLGGAAKDKLKKLGKNAVAKIMNPLLNAGESKTRGLSWDPPKPPPLYAIDKFREWTKATDSTLNVYVKKASKSGNQDGALKWARSQAGKPYVWGGVGPGGYDCSGFMSAITNVIRGKSPYSRVGATASFPWAGFKAGADPAGFTIGSTSSYAGGVGHMAGTLSNVNVESRGGTGVIVGPGARGYNDSGFNKVYHLYRGGIAKARRGGVLANIGDGRYDEAVVPLTPDFKNKLGSDEIVTHNTYYFGDLSFPNITDPDDAQTFLDNLEALIKD